MLEECCQLWLVLLFVGTVPKQAVQVGTSSCRVFSFGCIIMLTARALRLFVAAFEEYGDPDFGTKVLTGAAFTCDKNDELLFNLWFWERAGVSQHIVRVSAVLEVSQARLVQSRSLGRQRSISGVWPEVCTVNSAAQGQQVPGNVVYPLHGSLSDFGSILVAGPDTSYHTGKVPVLAAKSSGISRHIADRSTTLQQMEIEEWRGTSLNGCHQDVGDVQCSDMF